MAIIPELTNGEFESFTRDGVVLIDFFADWCMPCMMMGPILEDLGDEFLGKANIGKVNIDDNESLAQKFNISSIPAFVIFKDGQVVEELTGQMPQDELSDIIKKHI